MRHKRKIRKLENKKQIMTPKAQKTASLALDTEGQAEQLLDTVENYRKVGVRMFDKIKKMFLWIWKFKEQLISLLGILITESVVVYCSIQDYVFDLLLKINPYWNLDSNWTKSIVIITFTLVMALTVRNVCKRVGIGGLQYAIEVEQGKTDNKILKNKLSDNTIKTLKKLVKNSKEEIAKLKTNILQKQKDLQVIEEEIKSIQELMPLGVKTQIDYQNAVNFYNQTQNEITNFNGLLQNVETKLSSYEEQLK